VKILRYAVTVNGSDSVINSHWPLRAGKADGIPVVGLDPKTGSHKSGDVGVPILPANNFELWVVRGI
jgi:hypothetical protein